MSVLFEAGGGAGAALVAAGVALSASLAACAALPLADPVAQPVVVRVLVKLVSPSGDAAAISAEASRRAGVPVTYAAAASVNWHALALRCASAAECDAAIERMRSARATYDAVEIEGRKQRQAS